MNREEALDMLCVQELNALNIINWIYNDQEEGVCKNCKHSEPHYDKELVLICHKGVCNQILCQECGVTEDFGCMMFEGKNNEK